MKNLLKAEYSVCAKAVGGGGTVSVLSCSVSLSETVLIISSLPVNIYFRLCVSCFAARKKKTERRKNITFRTPAAPPPSQPPSPTSCILQSASISCLVTSLHLIPPLTPWDPGVAPATQGTAHRSSGNYPVGLEVARPKGTKPLSAVSKPSPLLLLPLPSLPHI